MKRIKLIIATLLIFAAFHSFSQTQAGMKAVFIYNFTKYIEWPAEYKSGDFVIGVLGSSPVTAELAKYAETRKAGSQNIVVRTYSSVGEISKCHMIYIPAEKSGELSSVISQINGNSTLIITEQSGLAKSGSGINFISNNDQVEFELNQGNITNYGMKINSKLTELGKVVN
mgnify:CR=1 FL=1